MSFKDFIKQLLFADDLREIDRLTTLNSELLREKNTEPIEKIKPLEPFKTKYEFRNWLINNPVDQNEYVQNAYDCEDFAIETSLAAARDGKWIFPIFDQCGHYSPLKMHVLVGTVINNILYVSEPQDANAQIISEERLDI